MLNDDKVPQLSQVLLNFIESTSTGQNKFAMYLVLWADNQGK